jgi:protein TonB
MKTKEIFVSNVAMLLVAGLILTAGYLVVKPRSVSLTSELSYVESSVAVQPVIQGTKVIKSVGVIPLPILPPVLMYKVLPQYPVSALTKGIEGVTLLSVYVGLSGQPEQVQVKSSSGDQALDAAAQQAVAQWRFSPATQGGAALSSWYDVPVRFLIGS